MLRKLRFKARIWFNTGNPLIDVVRQAQRREVIKTFTPIIAIVVSIVSLIISIIR